MEMKIQLEGGYKVNALYKGFTIRCDQPEEVGGENTAPEPFDIFLASIGTCAGTYLADFCIERKIPLDGIDITMRFHKNEETKMVTQVSMEVTLPPEFPVKYIKAIERSINQCTVKKHFMDPPEFEVMVHMGE